MAWNTAFPLLLKSPSIYLSDGKGAFVELFRHFFRQNGIFSVLHNSVGFFHALVMENPVTLRVARFTLKNPSIYLSNGKAVLAYVFGQILKILCFAQEHSQLCQFIYLFCCSLLISGGVSKKVPPYISAMGEAFLPGNFLKNRKFSISHNGKDSERLFIVQDSTMPCAVLS